MSQPQYFKLPDGRIVAQQPNMQQMPAHQTNIKIQGADGKASPMLVQAKDCVDQTALHRNISANLKKFTGRVEQCGPSNQKVMIVSAGPSAKKYMSDIKKFQEDGGLIVCVKHSLPILMDAGVIPDACVILDPREVEGISTHNIKRSTLFDKIDSKTVFLVASMTHPSVTDLLISKGARVLGWDAMVADITEWFKFDVPFAVVGGSCSAIRAITLFRVMGCTDFTLVGFDCEFTEPPKDVEAKLEDGRPKYIFIEMFGKKRITTGELVALVQDFERLFDSKIMDFDMNVIGEGLVKELYDKAYKPRPKLEDMFKKV